MDERRKKAFDFAQETSKQLITLATAVLGLTITFNKYFVVGGSTIGLPRTLVIVSWGFFLLSVAFGLVTLMALTDSLEPMSENETPPSIRGKNVTIPAVAQVMTFFLGLALAVVFGIIAGK